VLGHDFVLPGAAEERKEQKCDCRGVQGGKGSTQQIGGFARGSG